MGSLTKRLEKKMAPTGPGKVVDIKKYLAQTQDNPKLHKNGVSLYSQIYSQQPPHLIKKILMQCEVNCRIFIFFLNTTVYYTLQSHSNVMFKSLKTVKINYTRTGMLTIT